MHTHTNTHTLAAAAACLHTHNNSNLTKDSLSYTVKLSRPEFTRTSGREQRQIAGDTSPDAGKKGKEGGSQR